MVNMNNLKRVCYQTCQYTLPWLAISVTIIFLVEAVILLISLNYSLTIENTSIMLISIFLLYLAIIIILNMIRVYTSVSLIMMRMGDRSDIDETDSDDDESDSDNDETDNDNDTNV